MSLNKDDILEALGLQTRNTIGDWIAPAMIGFGIGAVLGASIALLAAPRSGVELREDLMERGRRVVQRGREQIDQMQSETRTEPRH